MLSSCLSCLGSRRGRKPATCHHNEKITTAYQSHEASLYYDDPADVQAQNAANNIVHTIATSESIDKHLRFILEDIVHQAGGWRESIATKVLSALEAVLQSDKISSALNAMRDKAFKAAAEMKEFAGEHPVLTGVFCTIVALGVLYLVWPAVLEALGFSSLGPVEGKLQHLNDVPHRSLINVIGSWAALWQSLYGGRVPVGSVFSFLQRLGMTVKWPLITVKRA